MTGHIRRCERILPHVGRHSWHRWECPACDRHMLRGRTDCCCCRWLVKAGLHPSTYWLLWHRLSQQRGRGGGWSELSSRWRRLLRSWLRSKCSVPLRENAGRIPDGWCVLFIARNPFEGVRLLIRSACDMAEVLRRISGGCREVETIRIEGHSTRAWHRRASRRRIERLHIVRSRVRRFWRDIAVRQWPALSRRALADSRLLHGLCSDPNCHEMLVHDRAVHPQSMLELERLARVATESFAKCIDLLLYFQLRGRGALLKYPHVSGEITSCLRVQSWVRTCDCNLYFVSSARNMGIEANLRDEA